MSLRRSPGSEPLPFPVSLPLLDSRPESFQILIPRRRMSAMTASIPFLSIVLIPLVLRVRVT